MESLYPFSTERTSLLGTETFRNLLGEAIKNSKKSIVVLSAYITTTGIKWLEEQINNKEINCTVVSRWNKKDLAQGSSDIACYDLAKKNNWKFKVLEDLHAKVMLIDNEVLFLGSPNLTGAGMSLIPVSNKEIGIKVKPIDKDLHIINQLVEDATEINDQIIEELKKWLKTVPKIEKPKIPDFPESVKESFKEKFNKLWVHNFPWSDIKELLNDPGKNNQDIIHDLELFGVTSKDKGEIEKEIKENFLNSKIFNWLISKLKNSENQEIYFGSLSSIVHDSLLDDPKPYRQDLKTLQANLYGYIKHFKPTNFQIDIPKTKSERIKLI
jgi:hypothetical protein